MKHKDLVRAYAEEINRDIVDVIMVVKGGANPLLEPVAPDDDPDDANAEIVDAVTHNTRRGAAMGLMKALVEGLHTGIIEDGVLYRALKLLEDADQDELVAALGFKARDEGAAVQDNDARNARMHQEVAQLIATPMSHNKAYRLVAQQHGVGKTTVENAYKEVEQILERRPSN